MKIIMIIFIGLDFKEDQLNLSLYIKYIKFENLLVHELNIPFD